MFALSLGIFVSPSNRSMDTPEVVLSLVGICATLIVGISLYDTISLNSTLRNYDEKMKELECKMKKIDELEKRYEKTKKQTNILLHFTWGLAFTDMQPYTAFKEYWRAILLAAEEDDIKRARVCISNAESLISKIKGHIDKNSCFDKTDIDNIPKKVPDSLRGTNVYYAFQARIKALVDGVNQIKTN